MALNYIPISSSASLKDALKQINENFRDIAAENQTKIIDTAGGGSLRWGRLSDNTYGITFNTQGGNTSLRLGSLTDGSYGMIISDANGYRRIFIGIKTNGEPIIAATKSGYDVIDELNA